MLFATDRAREEFLITQTKISIYINKPKCGICWNFSIIVLSKYPKAGDRYRRYYCQYLRSKYKIQNELKFVEVSQ